MRLLTSLYISDHRARVGLQHGALLVHGGDGKRTRVPLEAIEAVVLLGHAQVSGDVLAECTRRHIRVSALSRGGRIRFVVGGPTSGNVHLRLAQLRAADDNEHCRKLAQTIVAGKLQNCRRMLKRWSFDAKGLERSHLEDLAARIAQRIGNVAAADGDRLRGIEGEATRLYFAGLGHHLEAARVSTAFLARNRRPPRDPVNSLLSFAYGLVTAEIVGALESVGLDPQIGYLHSVRPGRPALALDLLEELRPSYADRFVVTLLTKKRLSASSFVHAAGGACYLSDESRKLVLDAYEQFKSTEVEHILLGRQVPRAMLPHVQAVLLTRHLRGDLPGYPPFLLAS